jgi:hypothetical protein
VDEKLWYKTGVKYRIAKPDSRSSTPDTKVREEETQKEHVTDGREDGIVRKEE